MEMHEAWRRYGDNCRGIVLIGHSIGGAIAARIAAAPGTLPIMGLALSGVGLRTPADHRPMWEALPDAPFAELPAPLKDQVMFGPEGSFAAPMPGASHIADAPALRAELIDIVSHWQDEVRDVLGAIAVPVHYRQGEFDRLWIVDEAEVAGFAAALNRSPRVDAAMMHGTGHSWTSTASARRSRHSKSALRCDARPRRSANRRGRAALVISNQGVVPLEGYHLVLSKDLSTSEQPVLDEPVSLELQADDFHAAPPGRRYKKRQVAPD